MPGNGCGIVPPGDKLYLTKSAVTSENTPHTQNKQGRLVHKGSPAVSKSVNAFGICLLLRLDSLYSSGVASLM